MLLSRSTAIRTGQRRKKTGQNRVDDAIQRFFVPAKTKKTRKGLDRPKDGLLTSKENWGPKKGPKPQTKYLAGELGDAKKDSIIYIFIDRIQTQIELRKMLGQRKTSTL